MELNIEQLICVLKNAKVDFILIGGFAALAHGSARVTFDLDVVYERSRGNLERLVSALEPFHPYLRGAPPGLPFKWDLSTLRNGLNFTLSTDLGSLDLFGEVAGGGTYQALLPTSLPLEIAGTIVRCVDLETLIRLKRAAGRPKDLEVIAELESLREEEDNNQSST